MKYKAICPKCGKVHYIDGKDLKVNKSLSEMAKELCKCKKEKKK